MFDWSLGACWSLMPIAHVEFARSYEVVNSERHSGILFSLKTHSEDRHVHCTPSFRSVEIPIAGMHGLDSFSQAGTG